MFPFVDITWVYVIGMQNCVVSDYGSDKLMHKELMNYTFKVSLLVS
jgi:hypothetical protein